MITFDEVLVVLEHIKADLNKLYKIEDKEKKTLAIFAKVTEEMGELSDEILSSMHLQKQSKLEKYDRKKLESEYTDVLVTVMLLGLALDVDLKKALHKRFKKDRKLKKWA